MPLVPPAPEPVSFEEVAAVLDAAVRARGGPPMSICAAGWQLAAALDQAGLTVVKMPLPGAQLTL